MPSYPTSYAPRQAWDRNGTIVGTLTSGVLTAATGPQKAQLNNSSASGGISSAGKDWLVFVFPNPMTIEATFFADGGTSDHTVAWEGSQDTTDGEDGTWASLGTTVMHRGDTVVSGGTWRSGLDIGWGYTVRGLRVAPGTTAWRTAHLYAGYANEQPLGLVIRSSAYEGIPGGIIDWGATPRGSSADETILVANTGSRTANNVVVTVEESADTDEFAVTHYLSTDGRNFAATAELGAIGPYSRSGAVTVRRVTPDGATLGPQAARLVAAATSWT